MKHEVDELRDLNVVDGDGGLASFVMTKFYCLAPSSFRPRADTP